MKTIQLIKTDTPAGKKYVNKINLLKKELGMNPVISETTKQIKYLSGDKLAEHPFLTNFLNPLKNDKELNSLMNNLVLKKVCLADFGRKRGYVHREIPENYFRFVVHLGSPELYYKDSSREQNVRIIMENGYGFIISPYESPDVSVIIYNDPIRLIKDSSVTERVSKIRPKDYTRTTLIFDFEYTPELDDDTIPETISQKDTETKEPTEDIIQLQNNIDESQVMSMSGNDKFFPRESK